MLYTTFFKRHLIYEHKVLFVIKAGPKNDDEIFIEQLNYLAP